MISFGFMHPLFVLGLCTHVFSFGFTHPCFLLGLRTRVFFWVYAPVSFLGFRTRVFFWVYAPVSFFGFTHPCFFGFMHPYFSLGLCTLLFSFGSTRPVTPRMFFFRVTIHPYGCVLPFVWRTFDICLGLCSFSGCIHILCLGLRTCSLFSGNFRSSLVHLLIFSWIMHPILCLPTTLISSVLMIVWASAPTNFIWGYSLLRL